MQSTNELNNWYKNNSDPWAYENNPNDLKRKSILLDHIPHKKYGNILDIGCGNGFITRELKGDNIIGTDVSEQAIFHANKNNNSNNIKYLEKNIFNINELEIKFDLIIITGVLYKHYLGYSKNLIYLLIDQILEKNGILISVHIDNWYDYRFPYVIIKEFYYDYREYIHRLEIYNK